MLSVCLHARLPRHLGCSFFASILALLIHLYEDMRGRLLRYTFFFPAYRTLCKTWDDFGRRACVLGSFQVIISGNDRNDKTLHLLIAPSITLRMPYISKRCQDCASTPHVAHIAPYRRRYPVRTSSQKPMPYKFGTEQPLVMNSWVAKHVSNLPCLTVLSLTGYMQGA